MTAAVLEISSRVGDGVEGVQEDGGGHLVDQVRVPHEPQARQRDERVVVEGGGHGVQELLVGARLLHELPELGVRAGVVEDHVELRAERPRQAALRNRADSQVEEQERSVSLQLHVSQAYAYTLLASVNYYPTQFDLSINCNNYELG